MISYALVFTFTMIFNNILCAITNTRSFKTNAQLLTYDIYSS